MKKLVITLITVLLTVMAGAVPADKTKFLYRQPDGSTILLQRHGDESFHWTSDASGRVMELDGKGFYVQSSMSTVRKRMAAALAGSPVSYRAWSSYDNPRVTNFGDRKVLCIIANFSDSTFVIDNPREKFDAMLNSSGYNYNNAIGSVREYYVDNSNGKYRPSFDVFGPVTLSHSSAYYDGRGGSVSEAIIEAYSLLSDQINISDYDTDNDGCIDMVLFYYPGHNEAEGASEESIWPHQGSGDLGYLGDKKLVRYFCTSELRGNRGTVMCPIGTTCHEFAHSLGIPDFYDTDYEKSGGENKFTTNEYDLMSSGCYNDYGRRPPYLNAVERNMLGWMDYPQEIVEGGAYTLEPVRNDKAYMSSTMTEGEYFVYEYRTREGWDSGIPEGGLLVYHVDKSINKPAGSSLTAQQLWELSNKINAYYGHPCFCLVEAKDESHAFPGRYKVNGLDITSWDGQGTGLYLSALSDHGNKASFTAVMTNGRTVLGSIYNSDGNPIAGVRVVLSKAAYEFQAPSLLKDDMVATTDNDGCYKFDLPDGYPSTGIISASAQGYVPVSVNVNIKQMFTGVSLVMLKKGQELPHALRRYDPEGGAIVSNFGLPDLALGMKFPEEDLKDYVGGTLQSISFIGYAGYYTDVYVIVDFGEERVLTKKVTDQYRIYNLVTVDLKSENIKIPAGTDVYFGFGFTDLNNDPGIWNLVLYKSETANNGNYWTDNVTEGPSVWGTYNFSGGEEFFIPVIEAAIGVPIAIDFSSLGVSYISVENDIPSVFAASGKTVKDVSWTVDGLAVDNPPALSTLSSGTHTYVASLVYYDGTSERVIYDYVR